MFSDIRTNSIGIFSAFYFFYTAPVSVFIVNAVSDRLYKQLKYFVVNAVSDRLYKQLKYFIVNAVSDRLYEQL